MIYIPAIYLPIHNGLIIIFTLAKYHCYDFSLSIVFNPAVWNPPALAGGRMRCNPREVALSSASRDNSTCKLQCTLFLKLGSHYYRESPAPAGGGSTRTLGDFLDSPVELGNDTVDIFCRRSDNHGSEYPKASFGNRFRSKLRGTIPSAARDCSTGKLQCTLFLKLGSHYNLSIPLRQR